MIIFIHLYFNDNTYDCFNILIVSEEEYIDHKPLFWCKCYLWWSKIPQRVVHKFLHTSFKPGGGNEIDDHITGEKKIQRKTGKRKERGKRGRK